MNAVLGWLTVAVLLVLGGYTVWRIIRSRGLARRDTEALLQRSMRDPRAERRDPDGGADPDR